MSDANGAPVKKVRRAKDQPENIRHRKRHPGRKPGHQPKRHFAIEALAHAYSEPAFMTLVEIMEDKTAPQAVRGRAASAILNKTLPDLSTTKVVGNTGGNFIVQVVRYVAPAERLTAYGTIDTVDIPQ